MSYASKAVVLNISKTFDRVWHASLLHRLKSYRILDQLFGISLFSEIEVPQHFVLHFKFFLLYINYLPDDFICHIAIYPDDTALYSK